MTSNTFQSNSAGESGGAMALNDTVVTIAENMFMDSIIESGANGSALAAIGGTVVGAANNIYQPAADAYTL